LRQINRKFNPSVAVAARSMIFNRHAAVLDEACFLEAFAERG
jgi:hypothetical protein